MNARKQEKKVISQGHIIVSNSDLAVVISALPLHKKLTKQEAGCLLFDVTQDLSNPNKFNVDEEFIDKDAFDFHQRRVKDSHWGKVTKNIERHYQMTSHK